MDWFKEAVQLSRDAATMAETMHTGKGQALGIMSQEAGPLGLRMALEAEEVRPGLALCSLDDLVRVLRNKCRELGCPTWARIRVMGQDVATIHVSVETDRMGKERVAVRFMNTPKTAAGSPQAEDCHQE